MRRARTWAAGALALGLVVVAARAPLACAPARSPEASQSAPRGADAAPSSEGVELAGDLTAVEAPLAARGFVRVAETRARPLRVVDGGPAKEVFEAPADPARDRCLRAAFVASERVQTEILVREVARARRDGRSGLVGDGPVCVRRGEVLRLVVHGPIGARVTVTWHEPARAADADPK
ncbi:MAG: hypothetical protein IPF92_01860 [Myxococcales bacterium]|nr:hypothetical protein [Myxococcales bacterium]MBL0193876.1 hypothetical protein [Myxococcales bacterium]HQY62557.1 hypothetical protein [Polyangiaceae bacterium]